MMAKAAAETTQADLQVFLVVLAVTMVHSTALAASVIGGVLQGVVLASPGTAPCPPPMAM